MRTRVKHLNLTGGYLFFENTDGSMLIIIQVYKEFTSNHCLSGVTKLKQ